MVNKPFSNPTLNTVPITDATRNTSNLEDMNNLAIQQLQQYQQQMRVIQKQWAQKPMFPNYLVHTH